jgi:hypothetical protein
MEHPQFEASMLSASVWNNHALVWLPIIMDVSCFFFKVNHFLKISKNGIANSILEANMEL